MAASTAQTPRTAAPATWAIPLAVAVLAWLVNRAAPLASPLILALVVGAVVANIPALRGAGALRGSTVPAKFMLRLGVAMLGFGLAVSDITQHGVYGIVIIVATVVVTFATVRFVGGRMKLESEFVTLIASGFAICGAAAIAAVQDSVRAKEHLVGLALALITLHGTVMLAVIPLLGAMLGLDDDTTALWAGASIHEVAQVAAAAALIGPGALAIALGIKLGRVLMLAPIHQVVAHLHGSRSGPFWREVPWFLVAFVVAVVIRATDVLPSYALQLAKDTSSILLAAGMFGLGLGIVLKQLWPVPPAAIVLSGVATATVTVTPLLLLLLAG